MAGDAEPSRVGSPLAVNEDEVRRELELLEGFEEDGCLPEGNPGT